MAQDIPERQPTSPLVESFETYQRLKQKTEYGLPWIQLGPVVNSARVEAVQLDPTHPGTIYAAFGSGNLWKTTNNGVAWKPIFENQASHGIGDFALAPSNPDIIYLGTGESLKKARNFTIPGTGVYRSDDGGEHWRHLGLDDSWHIGEIAIHPNNPEIAVVAVLGHFWSSNPHRGLYRTEDGGQSWQHVLEIDDRTGANDVVWSPSDPRVVYASTWENYPDVCGRNSSVYRSGDSGLTWQKVGRGLPSGDQVGRIGLAVSHTDADKVYALVDHRADIESGAAAQIFQSLDGGNSWNRTHETDLPFLSRIGWYFADIYVNPKDDNEVFGLGVRVAHSTDGGRTFDYLGGDVRHINPSAASGLHLDHCELWIHPENPDHLVLGNDGGLYQSFDRGQSWVHFNNLPTGEFYDLAVDQSEPYRIFAGAQDNATVFGPAREWHPDGGDSWKYLWIDPWNGGDGCVTQVDPADPNTVYYSAQEGAFRRKNMATNRSRPIRPRLPKEHPGELKFNFVAPLIISPHDSKRLFLAGNYLFQSDNRGDEWSVISPDLSGSEDAQRNSLAASAVAESRLVPGLLYVGTDRGGLWVSEDGGQHWEQRTERVPVGYVRTIEPSRHVADRCYVAVSGLNYDDFASYLLCTEDRGKTWRSISANLPDEPANVVIEDPVHENVLYAGTFRGVYLSTDRGQSWSMLGNSLPACSIADLVIQERANELVIATHGRGIYKLGLQPVYELFEKSPEIRDRDYLFAIPEATRPYVSDTRPGLNFGRVEKTSITYWLHEPGQVKLSVWPVAARDRDESNTESLPTAITSFSLSGQRGLNQFRWDLVVKKTASLQPYFINYREYLKPGEYLVRIETESNTVMERRLKLIDPIEQGRDSP